MIVQTSPSILVLENNQRVARTYGKVLNEIGCYAYLAQTLNDAQALLLSDERFDIFLCNWQIGQETSLNLLREVKTMNGQSHLKIILIAASGQFKAFADELGSAFFLEKPVDVDALHMLITRIVSIH